MFLDEKIVKMVLENKPQNLEDSKKLTKDIVNICFDRIRELFSESKSDSEILPNLKKVCTMFDLAAKKLDKMNYKFLKAGGLKDLLIHNETMSKTLKQIGFF